jgi:hypothetical protein
LDDYEEGTWTPAITGGTTSPTVTYLFRSGGYTKVGKLVYYSLHIALSAISGGSGTLNIGGLPFTAQGAGGGTTQWGYAAGSIGYSVNWAAGTTPYNCLVFAGSTAIRPYYTATLGGAKLDCDISNLTATTEVYVAGCYMTA